MTAEQLSKIPFRMVAHLSMEHEHCATFLNADYNMGYCVHTKRKDDGTFGRSYTHYQYNGEVYKTKAKFLEAIKNVKYHD